MDISGPKHHTTITNCTQSGGDIALIGKGAGITIKDSAYLVSSEENRFIIIEKFEEVIENPPGEWNSYDITSRDGNIEVVVNRYCSIQAAG